MILNKISLINFFGYIVLFFPLTLMIGPLVAEFFLLLIIIYSLKLSYNQKKIIYLNNYVIFFGLF